MSPSRSAGRLRLAVRYLYSFAIPLVMLIVAMAFVVNRSVEDAVVEELFAGLETNARIAQETMPEDPAALAAWVENAAEASDLRITVIGTDGVVIADSHTDPAEMENHADRPEVIGALAGASGQGSRLSVSTGFEQHYLALPPRDGAILRVSASEEELQKRLAPIRRSIALISGLVALVGVALVAWLARKTASPITKLTAQTLALADGTDDTVPDRSAVRELDQLALSIGDLDAQLRDRVAEATKASKTLSIVLEGLAQGTILIDEGDRIIYANRAARELLGDVPGDIKLLHPHPLQSLVAESRVDGSASQRVEHGRPTRTLSAVATAFLPESRVLLVIEDVTSAERSDTVRRDFVANASHELKTPIATILAASEAMGISLARGDGRVDEFARKLTSSAEQLSSLVSDLLDLSRLEREQPSKVEFAFDELVAEEVSNVKAWAKAERVTLIADLDHTMVSGARNDLGIAVRNLLDNAVRHAGTTGRVEVVLREDDESVVLDVSDTGQGIPTRDLERVFERFYRVDSARSRDTGGTGLGLAIVKHIVESHGGTVGVESELGVGSRFTVRVPSEVQGHESN